MKGKNLSSWKEILPSLVYFFLKNFASIRDFSISKPKEGKKMATKLIFVEFERPEDAASLFDHFELNEVNLFQARKIHPLHHRGYHRKYVSLVFEFSTARFRNFHSKIKISNSYSFVRWPLYGLESTKFLLYYCFSNKPTCVFKDSKIFFCNFNW
jgi:hypothetical protein